MKVYILGPMRNIPYFNFEAFDCMAARLVAHGHEPVNPADLDRATGFNPFCLPPDYDWSRIPGTMKIEEIVARDLRAITHCDAYVALDGWENSIGARAEKGVLDWKNATRLNRVTLDPWEATVKQPDNREAAMAAVEATTPVPDMPKGEVRVTDPKTGGQKGQKLQRFDLIPGEPLWELAEVYGRGAKKYADDNWRKGYSWKLSFGALNRHLWAWWGGEQRDEMGNHHLANVAWHAFTLMWYELFGKGTDDRPCTLFKRAS